MKIINNNNILKIQRKLCSFCLNAPPTLLITKGQGSQTICNSISTDYSRNLTIIYVVILNPCMLCYILIAIYILPSYMKKRLVI